MSEARKLERQLTEAVREMEKKCAPLHPVLVEARKVLQTARAQLLQEEFVQAIKDGGRR